MSSTDQSAFACLDYTDDTKARFYQSLRKASNQFGCRYVSYVYENTDNSMRIGFTSNPDWQREYIDNHMIDHCHLWNTVSRYFIETNRSSLILPWDTAKPNDKHQKDIILCRDEMDIGRNGISFCTQSEGKREFLAFAPDLREPNFAYHLMNNLESVRDIAGIFRAASQQAVANKEEHVSGQTHHQR